MKTRFYSQLTFDALKSAIYNLFIIFFWRSKISCRNER